MPDHILTDDDCARARIMAESVADIVTHAVADAARAYIACGRAAEKWRRRAQAAEAERDRLRVGIETLADAWGHEPHCDTRYGDCCATGQLHKLLDGGAS